MSLNWKMGIANKNNWAEGDAVQGSSTKYFTIVTFTVCNSSTWTYRQAKYTGRKYTEEPNKWA